MLAHPANGMVRQRLEALRHGIQGIDYTAAARQSLEVCPAAVADASSSRLGETNAKDGMGYNEAETSFISCRVIKQVSGRAPGHASELCRQNVRPNRNRALLAPRAAARLIEASAWFQVRVASSILSYRQVLSPASPCLKT